MAGFIEACKNGDINAVKLFLNDKTFDPNPRNNAAIYWAIKIGHLEIVQLLLNDPRIDPFVFDNIAIRWASNYGRLEVVRLLLSDHRVDPTTRKNYSIRWALHRGYVNVVRILLNDLRVLNGDQQVFKHPIIKQIMEENRSKKSAVIWFGIKFRKEWRYLCPVVANEIKY